MGGSAPGIVVVLAEAVCNGLGVGGVNSGVGAAESRGGRSVAVGVGERSTGVDEAKGSVK
jgi:hypothetical protein